ncbi:RNA-binding protein pno1 [Glycine soja]|uniref:RNA-binding protein pno1 n=1 Tax=Glycine soja TaxID=3848 RepID=A0A0B2NXQ6_GLYSO|nr:RNA-binding protein pno1 [Glycine soja]
MYWIAYKCFLYQEIDFFRHLLIVELSLPLYQKAVLSVLAAEWSQIWQLHPWKLRLSHLKPKFEPLKPHEMSDGQVQFRKENVPTHLKKAWMDIYTPIYGQMKIDVRMNLKARRIELKTRPDTPDISNLQFCIEFFEIKDVKTLRGEHLSRAIGRLSGKGGKTKFAIENASKTRIVMADTKIHILGSFANTKIARDSLCSLILGSPAGKVYSKLRAVTARLAERF